VPKSCWLVLLIRTNGGMLWIMLWTFALDGRKSLERNNYHTLQNGGILSYRSRATEINALRGNLMSARINWRSWLTVRQAGSQPAREPASQAASQPARQTNCRFLQFVLFCPVARLTLRHDSSSCTDVGNKPKIERQRWINKQLWIAKKRLFYNFGIWLTVVLCKDQRAIWRIR